MRRSLALWLLLVFAGLTLAQPDGVAKPLTLQQYVQNLDSSLAAVQGLTREPQKAEDFLRTLPDAWQVEAEGSSFEISTRTIRRDLGAWEKKPDKAVLARILQHLETLRYQAAGYQKPPVDSVSARARLNNILPAVNFIACMARPGWTG